MALGSKMSEKRRSTFGLQLGQLADLFAIAAKSQVPPDRGCADERLARKLRNQLTGILPGNRLSFPPCPQISEDKRVDVPSLAGQSLHEVLLSPQFSVEQLQVVKEASKRLTTMAVSEAERAVATTIYHAAIASCLVHHDEKITQHSYGKLDESFSLLIDKGWMVPELVTLFAQARSICRTKGSQK